MVVFLLFSLALAQQIDPQKFDCDKQCEDVRQMCLLACEKEVKHAKQDGNAVPMDCKTMCEVPSKRCKAMCVTFKQQRSKMGSMKQSDFELADDSGHEH